MKIRVKVYNAKDAECALCGCVSEYVFKIGEVTVEKRAHVFCPICAFLVDDIHAL